MFNLRSPAHTHLSLALRNLWLLLVEKGMMGREKGCHRPPANFVLSLSSASLQHNEACAEERDTPGFILEIGQ